MMSGLPSYHMLYIQILSVWYGVVIEELPPIIMVVPTSLPACHDETPFLPPLSSNIPSLLADTWEHPPIQMFRPTPVTLMQPCPQPGEITS